MTEFFSSALGVITELRRLKSSFFKVASLTPKVAIFIVIFVFQIAFLFISPYLLLHHDLSQFFSIVTVLIIEPFMPSRRLILIIY